MKTGMAKIRYHSILGSYVEPFIPFILETALLLAALIRPNHLVRLSS